MRDDAAAAARRIVEEVLARHGQGDALETEMVAAPKPADHVDEAAEAPAPPAGSDRDEPDDEPAQGERSDAETELLAAAGDAASVAAQIARRIVAEALAEADQPIGQAPADGLQGPQPEVSVRGVPAEGLPVEDEPTVGIELPSEPADTDDPAPRGAVPEVTPAADTPARDSAEEIVRRIVADVQSEASTPVEEPATPGSPGPDPDTTVMLEEQRPATETAALPQHQPVAVGAPPATRSGAVPAPGPATAAGRELEGWAKPMNPEPSVTTAPVDGAPRTLRWLLASLLGAVALAVLFPLAVAALRALVAMD